MLKPIVYAKGFVSIGHPCIAGVERIHAKLLLCDLAIFWPMGSQIDQELLTEMAVTAALGLNLFFGIQKRRFVGT